MMGLLQRYTKIMKMVVVFALHLFADTLADNVDDLCPSADMTSGKLVTSHLSVHGVENVLPLCGMQYIVPVMATLYQGMLAASQQQGSNFMFTTSVHPTDGHKIESINNVYSVDPFEWVLFDYTTKMPSKEGVDFIEVTSESAYLWQYVNTSAGYDLNYTGPCGGPSTIAFLTVSSENTNDAFEQVCSRPILIQATGPTAFTLLQDAHDQLPIYVKAVLDMQMNTVTEINGVPNVKGKAWTGYYAGSNMMIPNDLAMTNVSNGDHVVFRYEEVDGENDPVNVGAPSAGQRSILLYAVMLLTTVMPLILINLISLFCQIIISLPKATTQLMMGLLQLYTKMVVVFALLFADTLADNVDNLCPSADMTSGMGDVQLVNSYLSVDGVENVLQLCGMQYMVPVKATLYQGMLAASQQQGSNFMFTISPVDPTYGHFIESINNVPSNDPFYWMLFENATKMSSLVGVDFIDITSESAYLWQYVNTSAGHDSNYTGPCGGPTVIAPTMPLLYNVAFLTFSSENTNNSFEQVCNRPVLIQATGTTAFDLLQDANDQLPIYVKAVLDMQMNTVTEINGVSNVNGKAWTGYYAGSNMMIPNDLAMTNVSNGDHVVFRYEEVDGENEEVDGENEEVDGENEEVDGENEEVDGENDPVNVGAPSAGQHIILLYAVMLLTTVMPLI
ncbi:uncharacterized protein [Asterias amurensis]|uniref:uncharacterized protein n=1 Tax=Asterias amurensis TaxID=7602 RepID=UPI003AB5FBE8